MPFTKSYNNAGQYTIHVTASNPLEDVITATHDIIIQSPIVDSAIGITATPADFVVNIDDGQITFVIDIHGDIPSATSLNITGDLQGDFFHVPITSYPFTHVYELNVIGVHTIELQLGNDISTSGIRSYIVSVAQAVTIEDIVVSQAESGSILIQPVLMPVPSFLKFESIIGSGSDVAVEWIFADGRIADHVPNLVEEEQDLLQCIDSCNVEISREFGLPGFKTIKLIGTNILGSIERFAELELFAAMEVKDIVFTNQVIINETVSFTVILEKPMEVCIMFRIIDLTTESLIDIFWIGGPAFVCERSETLFGIPFLQDQSHFSLLPNGDLEGSINRIASKIGVFLVEVKAFARYSDPTEFNDRLEVLSVPCSAPEVITKPGTGDDLSNPILFRRSNINFIGTDRVNM